jgi:hypothetical protein
MAAVPATAYRKSEPGSRVGDRLVEEIRSAASLACAARPLALWLLLFLLGHRIRPAKANDVSEAIFGQK